MLHKLWDMHIVEYYSAMKRSKLLTQEATWMTLKVITTNGCQCYLHANRNPQFGGAMKKETIQCKQLSYDTA